MQHSTKAKLRAASQSDHNDAENTVYWRRRTLESKTPCRSGTSAVQERYETRQLRTAVVVVKSAGSAACLRCCPIGDRGVLRVGILFVVNRRCSWPRLSLAEEAPIWLPTARRGLVREANDDSSRGDRRPLRSPIPVEKAIFFTRNTLQRTSAKIHCASGAVGWAGWAVRGGFGEAAPARSSSPEPWGRGAEGSTYTVIGTQGRRPRWALCCGPVCRNSSL